MCHRFIRCQPKKNHLIAYYPTNLTRVFQKSCLLCDFFHIWKNNPPWKVLEMPGLPPNWGSANIQMLKATMTGQQWNLPHGKITRSTTFRRETIALSLGFAMVTFTHINLSEFWQNSEVIKVKSSLILFSTFPLWWGSLVAIIAQVVSHSMDLHSPEGDKPNGKTPFCPPPHLVSSVGTE